MRFKLLLAIAFVTSFIGLAFGQRELIINGGFELVNAGEWQIAQSPAGGAAIANGSGAANGVGYLSMGNVAGASQAVSQTIQFPTNLISAVFSFNYAVVTTDTMASDDILFAYILDTNRNPLVFLGSTSNLSPTSGYNRFATNLVTYTGGTNLSSYAGRAVEVYFQVTSDLVYGGLTSFHIDNVSMSIGTPADIPVNDTFTNSIALPTNSATVTATGTNTLATKESGEPNIAGNAGGHSVWWNWTAPAIGTVTISTAGSSFTTLLGVFTGSSVSNLTTVATSNGNNRGGSALVTFDVTPGTQYQIAVDGYAGQSGNIALSLKFTLDNKPPSVSITSPAAGAKVTNTTVVVQGKATDNIDVALVQFRLENASGTNDYQTATGTNTWTATVTNLVPGPNTIRVRAIDTSGNISAPMTRAVTYVVVSPLTLTVSGSGTVTPNLNGKLLALGSSFTVTAKPSPSNLFVGWTGDLTTNAAVLKFIMKSNLTLQANFIPNPFIPVAGVYQGLFYDTNGAEHQSSGYLNATVTSAGSYTAKILLAGSPYSLSGRFSLNGMSSNSIAPVRLPPVSVQLQLDLGGGGLSGQFSNGAWTSELNAFRAMASPPSGNYTLVLPGGDGDPAQPGGDGFGTLTVLPSGSLSFMGALGDGTKVTQKTILTPGGLWPFYASLYSGHGSILGWLSFSNQPDSDITGPVSWFKLAQPGMFYTAGFTNQNIAEGSLYRFTVGIPVLDFTNGRVWLANGNLSSSFTNQITLNSTSKVTNQSSNALTLTITTSNGSFKGSVVNPATGKPTLVNGVVLQKQNFGRGVFLGTTQTGRVYVGQ